MKCLILQEILVALNNKLSLIERKALEACSVAEVDRTPLPFHQSKRSRTSSSVPISWLLGSKEAHARRVKADSHWLFKTSQPLKAGTTGLQCRCRLICHMLVLEISLNSIKLIHNHKQTQTADESHALSSTGKLCVEIRSIID